MKTRKGFVSNSSTTSFCIYGAAIEKSEIAKLAKVAHPEEEDCDDFDGILEDLLKDTGLCYRSGQDGDDCFYIGRSWSSIKDDENGKQFKETIAYAIKEKFGADKTCSTHSQAWYNG